MVGGGYVVWGVHVGEGGLYVGLGVCVCVCRCMWVWGYPPHPSPHPPEHTQPHTQQHTQPQPHTKDILAQGNTATDASGNPILKDVGSWLRNEMKAYFKEADVKYIDPSYVCVCVCVCVWWCACVCFAVVYMHACMCECVLTHSWKPTYPDFTCLHH